MPNSNFEHPIDVLHQPVVASLHNVLFVLVATVETNFLRYNRNSEFSFGLPFDYQTRPNAPFSISLE